jgi:sec-independent protein translocase protein TatA
MDIGPTELIIVLLIVLLLFGVGRIGKLGGELGKGIRSFREGLKGDEEDKAEPEAAAPAEIPAATAEPAAIESTTPENQEESIKS